jgi:catechol 2,3-dioxygenase-like lactoylglutathione lyase family enzyme
MPVREFFHVMTIVPDYDEAMAFLNALFAPREITGKHWSNLDKRWASVDLVGTDFVWEPIEVSTDPEHAGVPLAKFRDRFGYHLHSLSWYADRDDLPAVVAQLQAAGVRVVGPDGSPVGGEGELPHVVFTHPKDTMGQVELMSLPADPGSQWRQADARFSGDWGDRSPTWWRDVHPLGIERLSHFTVATRDVDRAVAVYADAFGGKLFHREADRALVLVGLDTVLELATSSDPSTPLGRDLAENGELPHQVTFRVRDLDAAVAHATSVGAGVESRTDDTAVLDPATTHGMRIAFTTADLPGDPRP